MEVHNPGESLRDLITEQDAIDRAIAGMVAGNMINEGSEWVFIGFGCHTQNPVASPARMFRPTDTWAGRGASGWLFLIREMCAERIFWFTT
ncbi:hypothetical protein Metfor_1370 [Methanoregula formicica SMSP]|uniref:Uncharacterized protein n=1 Tax=Methanoregula formicica (strain DSM 22288 / NBRC 105244 / SMSP) TaxID=593750 RepID=L0HH56_METFS|nr:hypothetical protein Metfor_1370 [Methanoregula formicica SMSP]